MYCKSLVGSVYESSKRKLSLFEEALAISMEDIEIFFY